MLQLYIHNPKLLFLSMWRCFFLLWWHNSLCWSCGKQQELAFCLTLSKQSVLGTKLFHDIGFGTQISKRRYPCMVLLNICSNTGEYNENKVTYYTLEEQRKALLMLVWCLYQNLEVLAINYMKENMKLSILEVKRYESVKSIQGR